MIATNTTLARDLAHDEIQAGSRGRLHGCLFPGQVLVAGGRLQLRQRGLVLGERRLRLDDRDVELRPVEFSQHLAWEHHYASERDGGSLPAGEGSAMFVVEAATTSDAGAAVRADLAPSAGALRATAA